MPGRTLSFAPQLHVASIEHWGKSVGSEEVKINIGQTTIHAAKSCRYN